MTYECPECRLANNAGMTGDPRLCDCDQPEHEPPILMIAFKHGPVTEAHDPSVVLYEHSTLDPELTAITERYGYTLSDILNYDPWDTPKEAD